MVKQVDSVSDRPSSKARLSLVDSYHQGKKKGSEDGVNQLEGASVESVSKMQKESRKSRDEIDVAADVLSNELIAVLRSLACDEYVSDIQMAAETALRRLCWDVTVSSVLERVIQRIDDNADVIGLPDAVSAEPVILILRAALQTVDDDGDDDDAVASADSRTKSKKKSLKYGLVKGPTVKSGSIKSKKSVKSSPASLDRPTKSTPASKKVIKERLGGFVQGTLMAIESAMKMGTFDATNAVTLARQVCTADGRNEEFINVVTEKYRSGVDVVTRTQEFTSNINVNYQSLSDKSRLISRETVRVALSRPCSQCQEGGRASEVVAVRMSLHTVTLLPEGGPVDAQAASLVVYIIHELVGEIGVKALQPTPVEESIMCKFVGALFCAKKPVTHSDASLDPELESIAADLVHIEPVLHDLPISIDSNLVSDALSILSIKRDADFEHSARETKLLVERNSFRDLIHPEISRVPRLNGASEQAVCAKYIQLSRRRLSLQPEDDDRDDMQGEQHRRRSLGSEQSELSDDFADLLRNRPQRNHVESVIVESDEDSANERELKATPPNHNAGPSGSASPGTSQATGSSKRKGQPRATGGCTFSSHSGGSAQTVAKDDESSPSMRFKVVYPNAVSSKESRRKASRVRAKSAANETERGLSDRTTSGKPSLSTGKGRTLARPSRVQFFKVEPRHESGTKNGRVISAVSSSDHHIHGGAKTTGKTAPAKCKEKALMKPTRDQPMTIHAELPQKSCHSKDNLRVEASVSNGEQDVAGVAKTADTTPQSIVKQTSPILARGEFMHFTAEPRQKSGRVRDDVGDDSAVVPNERIKNACKSSIPIVTEKTSVTSSRGQAPDVEMCQKRKARVKAPGNVVFSDKENTTDNAAYSFVKEHTSSDVELLKKSDPRKGEVKGKPTANRTRGDMHDVAKVTSKTYHLSDKKRTTVLKAPSNVKEQTAVSSARDQMISNIEKSTKCNEEDRGTSVIRSSEQDVTGIAKTDGKAVPSTAKEKTATTSTRSQFISSKAEEMRNKDNVNVQSVVSGGTRSGKYDGAKTPDKAAILIYKKNTANKTAPSLVKEHTSERSTRAPSDAELPKKSDPRKDEALIKYTAGASERAKTLDRTAHLTAEEQTLTAPAGGPSISSNVERRKKSAVVERTETSGKAASSILSEKISSTSMGSKSISLTVEASMKNVGTDKGVHSPASTIDRYIHGVEQTRGKQVPLKGKKRPVDKPTHSNIKEKTPVTSKFDDQHIHSNVETFDKTGRSKDGCGVEDAVSSANQDPNEVDKTAGSTLKETTSVTSTQQQYIAFDAEASNESTYEARLTSTVGASQRTKTTDKRVPSTAKETTPTTSTRGQSTSSHVESPLKSDRMKEDARDKSDVVATERTKDIGKTQPNEIASATSEVNERTPSIVDFSKKSLESGVKSAVSTKDRDMHEVAKPTGKTVPLNIKKTTDKQSPSNAVENTLATPSFGQPLPANVEPSQKSGRKKCEVGVEDDYSSDDRDKKGVVKTGSKTVHSTVKKNAAMAQQQDSCQSSYAEASHEIGHGKDVAQLKFNACASERSKTAGKTVPSTAKENTPTKSSGGRCTSSDGREQTSKTSARSQSESSNVEASLKSDGEVQSKSDGSTKRDTTGIEKITNKSDLSSVKEHTSSTSTISRSVSSNVMGPPQKSGRSKIEVQLQSPVGSSDRDTNDLDNMDQKVPSIGKDKPSATADYSVSSHAELTQKVSSQQSVRSVTEAHAEYATNDSNINTNSAEKRGVTTTCSSSDDKTTAMTTRAHSLSSTVEPPDTSDDSKHELQVPYAVSSVKLDITDVVNTTRKPSSLPCKHNTSATSTRCQSISSDAHALLKSGHGEDDVKLAAGSGERDIYDVSKTVDNGTPTRGHSTAFPVKTAQKVSLEKSRHSTVDDSAKVAVASSQPDIKEATKSTSKRASSIRMGQTPLTSRPRDSTSYAELPKPGKTAPKSPSSISSRVNIIDVTGSISKLASSTSGHKTPSPAMICYSVSSNVKNAHRSVMSAGEVRNINGTANISGKQSFTILEDTIPRTPARSMSSNVSQKCYHGTGEARVKRTIGSSERSIHAVTKIASKRYLSSEEDMTSSIATRGHNVTSVVESSPTKRRSTCEVRAKSAGTGSDRSATESTKVTGKRSSSASVRSSRGSVSRDKSMNRKSSTRLRTRRSVARVDRTSSTGLAIARSRTYDDQRRVDSETPIATAGAIRCDSLVGTTVIDTDPEAGITDYVRRILSHVLRELREDGSQYISPQIADDVISNLAQKIARSYNEKRATMKKRSKTSFIAEDIAQHVMEISAREMEGELNAPSKEDSLVIENPYPSATVKGSRTAAHRNDDVMHDNDLTKDGITKALRKKSQKVMPGSDPQLSAMTDDQLSKSTSIQSATKKAMVCIDCADESNKAVESIMKLSKKSSLEKHPLESKRSQTNLLGIRARNSLTRIVKLIASRMPLAKGLGVDSVDNAPERMCDCALKTADKRRQGRKTTKVKKQTPSRTVVGKYAVADAVQRQMNHCQKDEHKAKKLDKTSHREAKIDKGNWKFDQNFHTVTQDATVINDATDVCRDVVKDKLVSGVSSGVAKYDAEEKSGLKKKRSTEMRAVEKTETSVNVSLSLEAGLVVKDTLYKAAADIVTDSAIGEAKQILRDISQDERSSTPPVHLSSMLSNPALDKGVNTWTERVIAKAKTSLSGKTTEKSMDINVSDVTDLKQNLTDDARVSSYTEIVANTCSSRSAEMVVRDALEKSTADTVTKAVIRDAKERVVSTKEPIENSERELSEIGGKSAKRSTKRKGKRKKGKKSESRLSLSASSADIGNTSVTDVFVQKVLNQAISDGMKEAAERAECSAVGGKWKTVSSPPMSADNTKRQECEVSSVIGDANENAIRDENAITEYVQPSVVTQGNVAISTSKSTENKYNPRQRTTWNLPEAARKLSQVVKNLVKSVQNSSEVSLKNDLQQQEGIQQSKPVLPPKKASDVKYSTSTTAKCLVGQVLQDVSRDFKDQQPLQQQQQQQDNSQQSRSVVPSKKTSGVKNSISTTGKRLVGQVLQDISRDLKDLQPQQQQQDGSQQSRSVVPSKKTSGVKNSTSTTGKRLVGQVLQDISRDLKDLQPQQQQQDGSQQSRSVVPSKKASDVKYSTSTTTKCLVGQVLQDVCRELKDRQLQQPQQQKDISQQSKSLVPSKNASDVKYSRSTTAKCLVGQVLQDVYRDLQDRHPPQQQQQKGIQQSKSAVPAKKSSDVKYSTSTTAKCLVGQVLQDVSHDFTETSADGPNNAMTPVSVMHQRITHSSVRKVDGSALDIDAESRVGQQNTSQTASETLRCKPSNVEFQRPFNIRSVQSDHGAGFSDTSVRSSRTTSSGDRIPNTPSESCPCNRVLQHSRSSLSAADVVGNIKKQASDDLELENTSDMTRDLPIFTIPPSKSDYRSDSDRHGKRWSMASSVARKITKGVMIDASDEEKMCERKARNSDPERSTNPQNQSSSQRHRTRNAQRTEDGNSEKSPAKTTSHVTEAQTALSSCTANQIMSKCNGIQQNTDDTSYSRTAEKQQPEEHRMSTDLILSEDVDKNHERNEASVSGGRRRSDHQSGARMRSSSSEIAIRVVKTALEASRD